MANDGGGGMRLVKYGCLGCAGLTLIVMLGLGGMVGVAWMSTEEPDVEDRVLTHEVPLARAAAAEGSAATQLPATLGKIVLDLADAEFELMPGRAGEGLQVEASYDKNGYTLDETFEHPEGENWEYTLRFRKKGSGLMATLRQMFSGSEPDIRIYLPPDTPFALDLGASRGAAVVELGGLWLTGADIDVKMGALVLGIDDPLREPMERLKIDVSMAGGQLSGLGNASPREMDVKLAMGGMQVDLRGDWRNDSEISITSSRSGGQLQLPRNVKIEGLDTGRFPDPADSEMPLPTLRFVADLDPDDWDVDY